MEVRLLSVGTRGFFLPASRLAIAASPLNSVAPNEKKTSGTRVPSIEMEAPFGRFGGTTVPRDYDTGNKKLTGNLNGTLVANVCLFEFYNF